VQVDSFKTRVERAHGIRDRNYYIKNCFQTLLSVSTCAATPRATRRR
jgi:hypothetical protein